MSAFLPESDSEDELPPGWEERATLQGEVGVGTLFNPTHSHDLPRCTMQTMNSRPLNGNTRGQDEGKQLEKTCLSVGREKFFLTIRYMLPPL